MDRCMLFLFQCQTTMGPDPENRASIVFVIGWKIRKGKKEISSVYPKVTHSTNIDRPLQCCKSWLWCKDTTVIKVNVIPVLAELTIQWGRQTHSYYIIVGITRRGHYENIWERCLAWKRPSEGSNMEAGTCRASRHSLSEKGMGPFQVEGATYRKARR